MCSPGRLDAGKTVVTFMKKPVVLLSKKVLHRTASVNGNNSGCLRGETLALTWKQVNLSHRMLNLQPGDTKEGHSKGPPFP